MKRALSVTDLLNKKYKTIPFENEWFDAFGQPQSTGAWLIWGGSTNGKTSFIVALIKELAKYYKVVFDSLEEEYDKSIKEAFVRVKMDEVKRKVHIVSEPISELSERLSKPKSPHVAVIDSLPYTDLTFKTYMEFRKKHADKLLIFICHADGNEPDGRVAKKVKYNVGMKIFVHGFRAFSQGRSTGPVGNYLIYEKGAADFGHEKVKNND